MAENESLDLSSSPRMQVIFDAFFKGGSCPEVSSKLERAVTDGLRKAIKQFRAKGVTLADLLKSRDCPQELRQLLRKTQGHDYARLFADAAATSGTSEKDCIAGWIGAVLDKMTDQICLRVAGRGSWSTIDAVQAFAAEVRDALTPNIERLVAKLAADPDWIPKRAPTKCPTPVDPTAELLNFSLLGATNQ